MNDYEYEYIYVCMCMYVCVYVCVYLYIYTRNLRYTPDGHTLRLGGTGFWLKFIYVNDYT